MRLTVVWRYGGGRISSHRPVPYSATVPADEYRQATEYTVNFITLPGFGTGGRITEYRHSRQAMFVTGKRIRTLPKKT